MIVKASTMPGKVIKISTNRMSAVSTAPPD